MYELFSKLVETINNVMYSYLLIIMLLALGDFTGNHTITMIAGFEGIFCGLSAIYSAMGQILNEEYGKTVIPLG
jgi:succinate-acetate transporter protein